MNPIRTNKPVFFGDDGEVLKSGQIYIGQPNQWPLSFPKTVTLQDSAGSQFTAAQPLKTGTDGRITYNGKSVIALVDGDYSILVRDRNGVTVGEGYTPFVENSSEEAGGSKVTQVGLLLSDIKLFDVTPGETVRNIGKVSALDDLGANWLVVSNTGNPADDLSLIDFSNGTQGQRIQNEFLDMVVVGGRKIVDSGSNADGQWVRFSDGTQICYDNTVNTMNTSTSDGAIYRASAQAIWTYPKSFSSVPSVSAFMPEIASSRWVVVNSAGQTSAQINMFGTSLSATAVSVGALAIGRWS